MPIRKETVMYSIIYNVTYSQTWYQMYYYIIKKYQRIIYNRRINKIIYNIQLCKIFTIQCFGIRGFNFVFLQTVKIVFYTLLYDFLFNKKL